RALAAPVASNGEDTVTTAGNSWGWGARTARINISAVAPDGNAGFNMGVYNEALNPGIADGDEANLWVKPIDMVKVSYGYYDNNTLRGDLCYGSWNWMRPIDSWIAADEGLLMSGLSGRKDGNAIGLLAEVTPMENLYIQAFVPITTENKAADTYKKARAGFAYTVPGLVKVKGQYIGKGADKIDYAVNGKKATKDEYDAAVAANEALNVAGYLADGTKVMDGETKKVQKEVEGNSNCDLEAEIDVLAVDGLFAGVGFRYDVRKDGKTANAGKENMKIALGASYQVMPELKVSASGAFFTYYGEKVDPRFQAGVGVDYDLGDGLAANADFRYKSKEGTDGKKKDNTDSMAFSVGLTKSVSSNGYIGVAFQGQTNSGSFATGNGAGVTGQPNDKGEKKNFTWCVPVALSVWF
ncbi:MAG TPA: hypothetical protein DCZ76_13785, partial [Treponema sp.]|nr:hypothetical protein [Treponema sp.]